MFLRAISGVIAEEYLIYSTATVAAAFQKMRLKTFPQNVCEFMNGIINEIIKIHAT